MLQGLLPQVTAKPSSLSSPDQAIHWLLISSRPQVRVQYFVEPFQVHNSKTFVNEGFGLCWRWWWCWPSMSQNDKAFTFELDTLSFMLEEMEVEFHTGRRIAKACLLFLILALMFPSFPPDWLILLPRYGNSLTSSIASPSMVIGASYFLFVRSIFLFSLRIFNPTCCTDLPRTLALSCMSCTKLYYSLSAIGLRISGSVGLDLRPYEVMYQPYRWQYDNVSTSNVANKIPSFLYSDSSFWITLTWTCFLFTYKHYVLAIAEKGLCPSLSLIHVISEVTICATFII